jgi:uncharacterized protein YjbJ (UPF0337 family)
MATARNTAQSAKGKVKEVTGRATGKKKLQAKGKVDQTKAKVKRTAQRAKRRAR